jgi:hypothetical protein
MSRLIEPAESTKENLSHLFRPARGRLSPSFIFTASHGIGWPKGHDRQPAAQGALLCQDFPGIGLGSLHPDHYFAATDLPNDARIHGMVCFHFACYGAGTPREDRFLHEPDQQPQAIAEQAFFSALPKALLSHPNGAALGVIGHVERAWQSSIVSSGAGPQLVPFENAVIHILRGVPLGYALDDFNKRYASLSAQLSSELEKKGFGVAIPDRELADLWLERNDAEAYLLFGDPAVCLRKDALQ